MAPRWQQGLGWIQPAGQPTGQTEARPAGQAIDVGAFVDVSASGSDLSLLSPATILARMGLTCAQWIADRGATPRIQWQQDQVARLINPAIIHFSDLPRTDQNKVGSVLNRLIPYCLGAGGGAALVAGLSALGTPIVYSTENAVFRRLEITVEPRELHTAINTVVSPYPLVVGHTLYHWAAPEAGAAWFREASRLLNGRYGVDGDFGFPASPSTVLNDDWNGKTFVEIVDHFFTAEGQVQYMKAVCQAIVNGYNAYNIVWSNDPLTRAAYRQWISGPPVGVASHTRPEQMLVITNDFIYGQGKNYGGNGIGWYRVGSDQPIITDPDKSDNKVGAGILARATRGAYVRYAQRPNPNVFLQTVGFNIAVPALTGEINPNIVDLEADVENGFWIAQFDQQGGMYATKNSAFPTPVFDWSDPTNTIGTGGQGNTISTRASWVRGDPATGPVRRDVVYGPPIPGRAHVRDDPDGNLRRRDGGLPGEDSIQWRWDYFVLLAPFINATSETPLTASVGPKEYLPYLRMIVENVLARRPDQVIQDARAFVMYENKSSISAYAGNFSHFLSAVADDPVEAERQANTPDPTLDAVANAAFAIGSAAAPATAGYSALIGAIVGGAILIGNRVTKHPISGLNKEDLGRWKPTYERGWLSGNPGLADAVPAQVVPAPPRFIAPAPPGTPSTGGRERLQRTLNLLAFPSAIILPDSEADRIFLLGDGAMAEFVRLFCASTLLQDGFATEEDRNSWVTLHPWCDPVLATVRQTTLRKSAPLVLGAVALALVGVLVWRAGQK